MATEVKSTLTIIVGAQNDGFTLEAIRPGSIRVEAHPLDLSLVYAHGDTLRLLAKKPQDVGVEKLKALGQTLYKTLFVPDIAEAFAEAERGLERAQDSIRIRIQTSVSEIGRLPWEVMHDGNEFVALRRRIVIVRGMGDVVDDLRTDVGRKLKVLYAWANPGDLPPLELGEPAKQIKGLLRTNNRIQFDVLENASLDSLSRSLLDDYHILCFAGHGTAEHLYLEDGDSHERISAQALANKLDAKPTRLVFLAACKAGGRTEDDLPGFAQTLASEAKMPAIAAMQYEVNDDEANLLTARYLEALAKLRPVDVALSEARDAIYEEERVVRDAFSPVLYLQTESSRLFRPDRNRVAIALLALFLVSLLAIALLYRYFEPRLTAAQQVAIGEAQKSVSLGLVGASQEAIADRKKDIALAFAVKAVDFAQPPPDAWSNLAEIAYSPGIIASFGEASDEYGGFNNIAFSSSGGLLAVGTREGDLNLYDVYKRGLLAEISFSHEITSVSFACDENTVAVGLSDGRFLIVDLPTTAVRAEYDHPHAVMSHSFDCQNNRVAIGLAADHKQGELPLGKLYVRDASTGQIQHVHEMHFGDVVGLDFSPDGSFLFSTSMAPANHAFVWSVPEGNTVAVPNAYDGSGLMINGVKNVDFSPNGMLAVSRIYGGAVNSDSPIVIWNVFDGTVSKRFDEVSNTDTNAIYTDNGASVVSATVDGDLVIWDMRGVFPVAQINGNGRYIEELSVSPDGTWLASRGLTGQVDLWKRSHGAQLRQLGLPNRTNVDINSAVDFDRQDRLVVFTEVGTRSSKPTYGALDITYIGSDMILGHSAEDEPCYVPSVIVNAEMGLALAYCRFSSDFPVVLYDTKDSRSMAAYPLAESITASALSPNGTDLVLGTEDGSLYRARVSHSNSKTIKYSSHPIAVTAIAFSPDGKTVLSGTGDGDILAWDLVTDQVLTSIQTGMMISALAVGREGNVLVGSVGGGLASWDLESGERQTQFLGHTSTIMVIEISPDGQVIATGSGIQGMSAFLDPDNSIRIWDSATGNELVRLTGHRAEVHSLSFGTDGSLLASSSADGTVRVWEIPNSRKEIVDWIDNTYRIPEVACEGGNGSIDVGSCVITGYHERVPAD